MIHLGGAIAFVGFGLAPSVNALTVVYARGVDDFASGVRVAPVKPPWFTDGRRVPSGASVKAIFTAGGALVVYVVAPALVAPRSLLVHGSNPTE